MSEAAVGRDYERWLGGRSLTGLGYRFLASVPGMMLVSTPAFRFDRELAIKPEHRVLDIACGRASVLQVLTSKVRFEKPPVGVDMSRWMLAQARRDITREGREIELARGSALQLPLASDVFDVVTCGYLIKHLDDSQLRSFLQELRRVIKPGGFAVAWEFAPTRSRLLNAWHHLLLTPGVRECNLRPFSTLAAYGTWAEFDWVETAGLRPFLLPPIPRVSVVLGKAPEGWREKTGPGRARRAAVQASRRGSAPAEEAPPAEA